MSEPFDFDAFIKGTQLSRSKVGFFRKDHRIEIADLTRQHDAIPLALDDEREASPASPRKALADKIAALRTEMEASRVEFTLRALTPDEWTVLQADNKLPEAEQKISVYDQLAWQSRAPEGCENPSSYSDLPQFSAAQWKKLADAIGFAQFAVITGDAADLIITRVAVPDFSRSVSQTLSPPTPSEN